MRLALPARIACRESTRPGDEWAEQTRLEDLTPFGASFTLTRPVEPGRLVHLTLPMPRPLRCFDHTEDQYRVWSVVRWLRFAAGGGFRMGVAFAGKHPPRSYLADPSTRYEIEQPEGEREMWRASERGEKRNFVAVRETRLTLPAEVVVVVLGEAGKVEASEQTVTENISRHGASVFSSLAVERGRFVMLRSAHHPIEVLAVVRGCRKGADNIPRLHLEFIDGEWPLEILG